MFYYYYYLWLWSKEDNGIKHTTVFLLTECYDLRAWIKAHDESHTFLYCSMKMLFLINGTVNRNNIKIFLLSLIYKLNVEIFIMLP